MAKVYDFMKKKEIVDYAASEGFSFGDEIMMKDNEYWKGMVADVKKDGVVVMKYGVQKNEPWFAYVLVGKHMIKKTGRVLASKESFINWFDNELKNHS